MRFSIAESERIILNSIEFYIVRYGCENETKYHDEREFIIPKGLHHKIYDICESHKKRNLNAKLVFY